MQIFGQVYTDKIVGEKNQELKDSLSTVKYPYALPCPDIDKNQRPKVNNR
jgi:hypothetical protein